MSEVVKREGALRKWLFFFVVTIVLVLTALGARIAAFTAECASKLPVREKLSIVMAVPRQALELFQLVLSYYGRATRWVQLEGSA